MTSHSAKSHKPHIVITAALLASLTLSGCGVRGSLKTPPPIWGGGVAVPAETPDETTDNTATNG